MAPANQNKSDHSKYVYFQPGEVLFVTTHTGQNLDPADPTTLVTWSNLRADAFGLTVQARPVEELLRFPASPDFPGQIYFAQLPQSYQAPRPELMEKHNPFTIVLADVKDKGDPNKYVESTRLAQFIEHLDGVFQEDIKSQSLKLSDGTTLELVSPNWLSSPTSETGGGGGPGGRPVPFSGNRPPSKTQFEFHLPQVLEDQCADYEQRGFGVTVAILDTAPSLHDLAAAYEKWQKLDPVPNPSEDYPGNPQPPHGLIETLLKPGGPLTVFPASYAELMRMRSVHLKDHNYNMTSHGLFVAGIIHSIAPAAKIHLYEVLNPDGVGDLKSIALGFSQVLQDMDHSPGERFLVNCSLILNIPLLFQSILDLDESIKEKIIHDWDKHKNEVINELSDEYCNPASLDWLARQARIIGWMCDIIFGKQSRVIAAAGNDNQPGRPESQRPQARYPAAFESVKGVGALARRARQNDALARAKYSDRADKPQITGIGTLGGEKGRDKGVLGVFLGDFPKSQDDNDNDDPAPKNGCDWAWWAGTSFAAPIITGILAALLSKNTAWTIDYALSQLPVTKAAWEEFVLEVTQGPPPPP